MNNRAQESRIKDQEIDRMERLLRSALPAVDDTLETERDLWPSMLRHVDKQSSRGAATVPWFDWALGGALLAFIAIAPQNIPVILYYL